MVVAEDECHVVWGDAIGYVWGRRHERTAVPIDNVNQRQTYDGVINLYNHEFILNPTSEEMESVRYPLLNMAHIGF